MMKKMAVEKKNNQETSKNSIIDKQYSPLPNEVDPNKVTTQAQFSAFRHFLKINRKTSHNK